MIKGILFDLDNTLVDFEKMRKLAVDAAISSMKDCGLKIAESRIRKILKEVYEEKGSEYGEVFQEMMKKTLGKVDDKILAAGIVAYRRVKYSYLDAYPGTIALLNTLKARGYKIAIVSDAPRLKAWERLVCMKIHNHFNAVITYDDTKKTKPDSLPFRKALNILKLKPSEVIMVGNDLRRDILGANKMKIVSVFAQYGRYKIGNLKIKPNYTIKEPLEVLDLVKNI